MSEGARGFKDLKIWQKGYGLLLYVNELICDFPDYEKFALTVQIVKSTNSIIANIAESHGRFHFLDKIKSLYIARGELEETLSHIEVAFGLKYINDIKYKHITSEYEDLNKSLNSYINYLYKQKQETNNENNNIHN